MATAPIAPPRVLAALGVSLLAHAGALFFAGPTGAAPPQLPSFEPIEVSLAAAGPVAQSVPPPSRVTPPPARKPPPELPMADEPASPSPHAAPIPRTAETEADETMVRARYQADMLDNPKPPYPLAARLRGQQGRLLLAVQVFADGRCGQIRIEQSSGYALLDDAARQTVQHWHFLPARRGSVAVDAWVEIPITFRLEG